MPSARPKLEAVLDPAIELLGAVDRLGSGVPEPACAAFRKHPAVRLNARMHASDPDYFQRKDLLLKRSAPPDMTFDPAMAVTGVSEAERSGAWEPWLAAMRDFARDAKFSSVFSAAARRASPALRALRARIKKADHVRTLESYAGLPFRGHYRIVVSPAGAGRGLNRVWVRDDGLHEIVSVMSSFDDDGLDAVVWHELGHGVLDMTANLYDHEHRDTPLPLGPGFGHNCRNWLHGMREHFVRAVMIRLIALERGEKAAARQYEAEEFSAKPHLGAFLERLREYEASRRDYPTLADFYPRLAEAFPHPAPADAPPGAGPFQTAAQRARALAHLDRMLERSRDERLLRRRDALLDIMGKSPA